MSESDQAAKGFKVTDRRKFTPEGELRREVADEEQASPEPAGTPKDRSTREAPMTGAAPHRQGPSRSASGSKETGYPPREKARPSAESRAAAPGEKTSPSAARPEIGLPPEVDFLSLVGSLAGNAMVLLGELPEPVSGQPIENLRGVQEIIAILAMLETKTKGNLTGEESRTLDDLLYDLRMRFMAKAKLIKL